MLNEQVALANILGIFLIYLVCEVKSAHNYQIFILCLPQTLTNHEGGVSLKGIERTLALPLLRLSLQRQLSFSKRLSETKKEIKQRERS